LENEERKIRKIHRDEEFNYFLSVIFPHSELKILSYNRVVKDLNSMSVEDFKKPSEKL
jgi:uncharacterized protein (DUF1015 family)